jgi:hypothetical protein
MEPGQVLRCPNVEAVTVAGDNAQYYHRLLDRYRLYRLMLADRVPDTPTNGSKVLGELIDDNDSILYRIKSFLSTVC